MAIVAESVGSNTLNFGGVEDTMGLPGPPLILPWQVVVAHGLMVQVFPLAEFALTVARSQAAGIVLLVGFCEAHEPGADCASVLEPSDFGEALARF